MKTITCDPLHDHTWRDIDGPLGLLLDGAFCSFIIVAALGMMPFALLILLADYVISPVWACLSKLRPYRPMSNLRDSPV
jgi:hypothetical protein